MTHPLDNPVWHALTGPQRHLAIGGATARRVPGDIGWFGSVETWSRDALDDLMHLFDRREVVITMGADPPPDEPYDVVYRGGYAQMVCEAMPPARQRPPVTVLELGASDVDDMLALVELTQPGPFRRGTHTLGRYIGVRDPDGRLVAMAGQRLTLDGYTEVSAVCTHPEARGRGLADLLVRELTDEILARGAAAFLHVSVTNDGAGRVYERLGFRTRAVLQACALRVQDERS